MVLGQQGLCAGHAYCIWDCIWDVAADSDQVWEPLCVPGVFPRTYTYMHSFTFYISHAQIFDIPGVSPAPFLV